MFLMLLAAVVVFPQPLRANDRDARHVWQKRWVYIAGNLCFDENIPKIDNLLRRASKAGYTGVLYADMNMLSWWKLEYAERWRVNAAVLRKATADLNLGLVFCVFPFGYSDALLFNDVNLAAGMPIKNASLVRSDGLLVPVQTAAFRNGSFEEYRGDRASGYLLQDNPGRSSFIDTKIFKEGRASLRFENVGAVNKHGHGRIFQRIAVKPWQQYRIRVWMKTEHLTADFVRLIALAGRRPMLTGKLLPPVVLAGSRALQIQALVVPEGDRFRYIYSARDVTTDWVEQAVTFNSLDNTSVTIGLGVWGGKTGTVWWDDLRIDAVPTLNVLRRSSVPLTIFDASGAAYQEESDFDSIADPGLGMCPRRGAYDTRHEPPRIHVPEGSRIENGERVSLSCYHTAIVYEGQVGCSLSDPKVFELCTEQIRRTEEALSPDGYFMSHDEIRCAGWEPEETKNFRTSGELLAYNIRRCYEIVSGESGGKPVYVWSDMFDPNHNARAKYLLVNNTIAGSWNGLNPNITVMQWGTQIDAAAGLRFFSRRGNKLMIATYYDGDVEQDYTIWKKFTAGVPGIIGVMYTTWQNDYSNLERFAEVWWGGGKQ